MAICNGSAAVGALQGCPERFGTRVCNIYPRRCRRLSPAAALPTATAASAASSGSSGPTHTPHSAWHTSLQRFYSSPGSGDGIATLPPTQPAASSSSSGAGGSGGGLRVQLVRDFIHDSLYHPTEGYFSKQTALGGRLGEGSPWWHALSLHCSASACVGYAVHPLGGTTTTSLYCCLAHCLQVRVWWAAYVHRWNFGHWRGRRRTCRRCSSSTRSSKPHG